MRANELRWVGPIEIAMPHPPKPPPGAFGLVVALLTILALVLLAGCGASQQRTAHLALNGITDVADPTYQMAVDTCDGFRNAIVARTGTTYAQDRSAMDQVHEVCDPMVAGFESLRSLQVTARAAIDSGQLEATVIAAVQEALTLWGRLRALIPQLGQLGRTGSE